MKNSVCPLCGGNLYPSLKTFLVCQECCEVFTLDLQFVGNLDELQKEEREDSNGRILPEVR